MSDIKTGRTHASGKFLLRIEPGRDRLPPSIAAEVDALAEASRELRSDRELAF